MWQNYVDRYNKFQWWLSGVIYGLYIGAFVQKVRGIRNIWASTLGEKMAWKDAVVFTIEIQFGLTSYDEMVEWLMDRGYTVSAEAWPDGTFPVGVTAVSRT